MQEDFGRLLLCLLLSVSLLSAGFVLALWMSCLDAGYRSGFERRVDAAISRSALEEQNAYAVIGTWCRHNGQPHDPAGYLRLRISDGFNERFDLPARIILKRAARVLDSQF
jgi:hypothetical protein